MIDRPEVRRRAQEQRSQVALEVLLIVYAIATTVVIARTVLILLDVSDRIWIGRMIYGTTDLFTDPLSSVPGFSAELVGPLTMVDLLLLGLVALFPLGLMATSKRTY
jgi:hypothetical protein